MALKSLPLSVYFSTAYLCRIQRRALAKSLKLYRQEFDDAKQGMIAAYGTGDYTLQAIADAFKVHYSTVSRVINGK